ncbi:MFS transporter [Acetobacter orientalis]|uniref:Alpha-ketoglutarate/sugar transporter n=1 Tax=Acetobacter orientalis TaxID=146474 RepID=A0A2Z5ZF97_9PROT|nr:MFS transporter [Acetobacter orientalis]BBC79301.1 alpha-ketoglutarate/sugar transporter [Acetobacter orientalis]GAN65422.1 alpha-ketoglutarate/sugar transporter [Acetobacter orientalis]GBR18462.1 citrate-proton symporter [Acetobacter orientalis NRIC 0481]GEL62522.1 citrate transporter [Acetobacter orientalis]
MTPSSTPPAYQADGADTFAAHSVTPAPPQTTRERMKAAAQVASGNMLEMYDFMVFGYYAAAIGRTFFPSSDPYAELLLSFATFGAGFLMRPLGAFVLGAYVDRIGRRKGLILTLTLMAIGTLTLTLTPGYAAIGLLAPLMVLAGRLLQGFSAGVELGSTSVYLAEIAKPYNKGFIVSFQSASQQIAVMVAAALGVGLASLISAQDMAAWGWRIPLLIGCLIVPVLFFLRRHLQETEAFATQHSPPKLKEILTTIQQEWRVIVTGLFIVLMTTTSFYIITAYTPSFGSAVLHLSAHVSLVVTLCVGLSNFVLVPVFGALSDKIGRKPLLTGATALAILTAYPTMHWLVSAPSFGRLLSVELWLSVLYSAYNGAAVVYLTEIVPPRIRTTGFSLAYSLATCVGGFTPTLCTWLIHTTGNRAMPGLWLAFAALCGLIASVVAQPYDSKKA